MIRESWPNAVEWYITKIEYNELGFMNYNDPNVQYDGDNMQHRIYPNSDPKSNNYTPIFIDMVDDYNQSLKRKTQPVGQAKCPYGGTWDGTGCLIETAPAGETARIIGDDFYYSPIGCCSCPLPESSLDGSGCLLTAIHSKAVPYIVDYTKMYYKPIGYAELPYDEVKGYNMSYLESIILPVTFNLSTYRIFLKSNKPSALTDKELDVYLDYFVGL